MNTLNDIMEYTAQDSDDVVACLQAISEWCGVKFTKIHHIHNDSVISCKKDEKPNGLTEATKYLADIMKRKKSKTLRIVYEPSIKNQVLICNT